MLLYCEALFLFVHMSYCALKLRRLLLIDITFHSLDPITCETLHFSDVRGFLPPGYSRTFRQRDRYLCICFKNDLITNDVVTNEASKVFDNNAAIITNTWVNTIDKTPFVASVTRGIVRVDTTEGCS